MMSRYESLNNEEIYLLTIYALFETTESETRKLKSVMMEVMNTQDIDLNHIAKKLNKQGLLE